MPSDDATAMSAVPVNKRRAELSAVYLTRKALQHDPRVAGSPSLRESQERRVFVTSQLGVRFRKLFAGHRRTISKATSASEAVLPFADG